MTHGGGAEGGRSGGHGDQCRQGRVRQAIQLIKEGKPIKYEGVIGPIAFDQYGDITGPFRLWRIQDGEITTVAQMSTEDVE